VIQSIRNGIKISSDNFLKLSYFCVYKLLLFPITISFNSISSNGRESAINRAIDGSTYPGKKVVPSSLCKQNLVIKKHKKIYLGLVPSRG
jgi:hypothetical protein